MNNLLDQVITDELSISTIIINLLIGSILSIVLKLHFEKFSSTLSGKKELSKIIPFLILIVCLIISIVKSSLALSLGLVGALSIVRFRTPIKEPEELVYLFMCIAIGLGLGANQPTLTIIATLFILTVTAIYKWQFSSVDNKDLYLTLSWDNIKNSTYSPREISELIAAHSVKTDLKRHDIQNNESQIVFFIGINSHQYIYDLTEAIKSNFPNIDITFIDQSRIPGI